MEVPREDKFKNIMDIWIELKKNIFNDVWICYTWILALPITQVSS